MLTRTNGRRIYNDYEMKFYLNKKITRLQEQKRI